jgi:hypothetical protein
MKIWYKMMRDNHLLRDMTVEDYSGETRTHKIFLSLDDVCREFDLCRPIWLDSNIAEFKKNAKTKFRQDSFIEQIEFDYLEVIVLEED